MAHYRVEYAIDVEADNPREACLAAWDSLTGMAGLPVGEVFDEDGNSVLVDLEADENVNEDMEVEHG